MSLNTLFARCRFLVFSLGAIGVLCGQLTAQDWKTVKDGIEYAKVTRETSGLKVNMNLIRLDLTKVRLDVVHAMDAAIGTEKTSSIATRHGAFAAINAGFFRLDTSIFAGDGEGVLQIDKKVLSEAVSNRIALLISNKNEGTSVQFEHTKLERRIEIKKDYQNISGVNRERGKDELIEYTPVFHRTTLTSPDGVEVVVRKNKIVAIFLNQGNNIIPDDGYILSASGSLRDNLLKLVKIGRKIDIVTLADLGMDLSSDFFTYIDADDIVGGVPQLIKNGKIDITWEQEKTTRSFVETRHPRTAVAKLKDGKFLMITVDGRSESSGGIGLQDLAEYLLSLGATNAMNIDGGGSTTMFLNGKVVNHPSDKEGERRVSDAILVTPRQKKH